VTAPAGDRLSVELQEHATPDTGAAPPISYTGSGTRLTDANGVELAARPYPGLTRDDAPPVFMHAATADRDVPPAGEPGQIDEVDLVYSEDVEGAAPSSAFSVGGRVVESVVDGDEGTALRITEAGTDDTDATPSVSYTPPGAPGALSRLRDLPEGPFDDADEAAPFAVASATDGAGPAIVSAETGDENVDGVIDQLDVGFSEPVDLDDDGPGQPISLTEGLAVTGTATTADPEQLSLTVAPDDEPNGGLTPQAIVTDPARVTDAPGNGARGDASDEADDAVRPILVSARLGEEAGVASCDREYMDGSVDCVRGTWSEGVEPAEGIERFGLGDFTLTEILGPGVREPFTDLRIDGGSSQNRSAVDVLSYNDGANPVTDGWDNPAIATTVPVAAACPSASESPPNDTRTTDNAVLSPSFPMQAICAGDGDYFQVFGNGGHVGIGIYPTETLAVTARLVDGAGVEVDGSEVSSSLPGGAAVIEEDLAPGQYWLHVTGATPGSEGEYCVNSAWSAGETCEDGEETEE